MRQKPGKRMVSQQKANSIRPRHSLRCKKRRPVQKLAAHKRFCVYASPGKTGGLPSGTPGGTHSDKERFAP